MTAKAIAEQDMPDLYLVDTELETSERISVEGMMPAFSPNGKTLVYMTSKDGLTAIVMLRDLESGTTSEIFGSEGASTLFWIADGRLGLTFELDDDYTRLVEINLASGEATDLIGD